MKTLIIICCVFVAISADKTKTEKPLLETASQRPHDSVHHNHFVGKIEQVLTPPKPKSDDVKLEDKKDLKQSNTIGIGFYGVPVSYSPVYPAYYPYPAYYRRPYFGYGLKPYPFQTLPIYGAAGVIVG